MTDLIIRRTDVLQIAPDPVHPTAAILRDHDVLIRGNRIESVQPTGVDPSHFRRVIDGRGRLAMPGLINTHAHVPMVIFRGLAEDVNIDRWFNDFMWPLESNLQPDDVYWGMLLGALEMLLSGVTTVADHYFFMDRAAEAVERAGSRALLGWAMFGSQGMGKIDETAAWAAETQGAADGRIRTLIAPHAPYTCDDAFLRASAAAAQRLGVGIHIHAAETPQQTQSSLNQRGITPIQVLAETGIFALPTIIAHALGALPSDIALMARHAVGIAHAPKTYMKLAMSHAPVLAFRAAGIPVGLATDGAVSNNTLDIWESLRLMPMVQKAVTGVAENMTIPEALYVATRESARVIGMGDQLGSLEAGYLADLILLDMSGLHHQPLHSTTASLVYNTRASDVHTVICNGRVLVENGALLHIDPAAVIAQVRTNMERLAQRIPNQRIQVYNP
ncbi:MAG: amidohydrolase [bacterium]|nr:amidohydrolase [bacterium]